MVMGTNDIKMVWDYRNNKSDYEVKEGQEEKARLANSRIPIFILLHHKEVEMSLRKED